jgi:hypothetical protein
MGIQKIFHMITPGLAGLAFAITVSANAVAQDLSCPLPGQKPTLVVQLFFGQSIANRGPVTPREWNSFLLHTVTPRFADGFTVYNAYGQWLDTETHRVTRENSKVIVILTADTAPVRANITELSDIYRKQFHQQSVAIVTNPGCSAF